jgi:hypothetical protein
MQLRSRREVSTKDAMNARIFEQWQTDGASKPLSKIDLSGNQILNARVVLDMNPINTRSSDNVYKQSQPFIANGPQLGMNPYFDRYDPTFDPKNAIRELRSAVYEDKNIERGAKESKELSKRSITTRWLPEGYVEATNMNTLLSYEMLKPQISDFSKDYRNS